MKFVEIFFGFIFFIIVAIIVTVVFIKPGQSTQDVLSSTAPKHMYWFELHRKSQIEFLYYGEPNNKEESKLVKTFIVKTGIAGERPTPLPQLVGREYWKVIKKEAVIDNPETAPYFLTLDVPAPSIPPYGPEPYTECNGQCDWITFGEFGLHGVNGDMSRLSPENPGSSGCIRHSDEDITYLYNLLKPDTEEIRYYILDV